MDVKSREGMLLAAGLTVLDAAWMGSVPGPVEAWRPIIRGGAEPSDVVTSSGINYLDEVNERWLRLAESWRILDETGEFLISVAGVGASTLPWARVRVNAKLLLAQILVTAPGEPEFVAMASDGHAVCGVTTEERDIWIVCANMEAVQSG
jgi:hypothetical protein